MSGFLDETVTDPLAFVFSHLTLSVVTCFLWLWALLGPEPLTITLPRLPQFHHCLHAHSR